MGISVWIWKADFAQGKVDALELSDKQFLRADEDILFRTPKVGAVSAKWVPFSVRLYFPLTKQS